MRKTMFCIAIGAITSTAVFAGWNPDQGNGMYQNPILYADYSDPDVIRLNDDYYMVASSFNCSPGANRPGFSGEKRPLDRCKGRIILPASEYRCE